jgi:hypothetical protein
MKPAFSKAVSASLSIELSSALGPFLHGSLSSLQTIRHQTVCASLLLALCTAVEHSPLSAGHNVFAVFLSIAGALIECLNRPRNACKEHSVDDLIAANMARVLLINHWHQQSTLEGATAYRRVGESL